jgi:hypothetical protein
MHQHHQGEKMTQHATTGRQVVDDAERIDVNNITDLDHWSSELGLSHDELVKVVEIAGDKASDVVDYVHRQGSPGNTA